MGEARQHYNVTLGVLALAGLAYALQQTMILPALPSLQRDLHTSTAWATWLFTAFLLVSAVATPVLGKLGDQYGKERFLLVSLLVFFVGCVAAIFAWNIWSLIVFRAIQGVGGAVFPLSFAIVCDEFPPEKVGAGVGLVSAVLGIGGGLGLVLSGVLVDIRVMALAVHRRRAVRRRRGDRRLAVRSGVADQDAVEGRRTRGGAALGRVDRAPARDDRRAELGLGLGPRDRSLRRERRSSRGCGCEPSCASRSRWSTCG